MARKIPEHIFKSSMDIIDRDRKRNVKFKTADELFYNTQKAPKELVDELWFRLVPTTAPSDAVWGATRTLSSIEPALTFAPIGLKDQDKDNADKIERVLTAIHRQAERRSKSKYTRQTILNALHVHSLNSLHEWQRGQTV